MDRVATKEGSEITVETRRFPFVWLTMLDAHNKKNSQQMTKLSIPILFSILISASAVAGDKINSGKQQGGYNFDANGSSSTIHGKGVSATSGSSKTTGTSTGEIKVITGNNKTVRCRLLSKSQKIVVGEVCKTMRRGGRNDNTWTECGPEFKTIKIPYAVSCS